MLHKMQALRGGQNMRLTPVSQIVAYAMLFFVLHVILAILFWSDSVKFANTNDRNVIASFVTVMAFALLVFIISMSTSVSM